MVTTDKLYTDVTEKFFKSVGEMAPGAVVSSPLFDMLDSARAIEMGNRRLDSGLIEISDEQLHFDATAPQNPAVVAGIMKDIVVSVMSWVHGLSLPTTFFCSRYVLDFLQNLSIVGGRIDRADFINRRLHSSDHVAEIRSRTLPEHVLVNKVLLAFVAAMTKFVGFVRAVALNVLFDEEDLTTRDMDFNLLVHIDAAEIVALLDNSIEWMTRHMPGDSNIPQFLRLARGLVLLDKLVQTRFPLFTEPPATVPWVETLDELIIMIDELSKSTTDLPSLPPGCISRLVQLECGNKHIPHAVYAIESSTAFSMLHLMTSEIRTFVIDFSRFRSLRHLLTYLAYTMAPKMTGDYCVIARGIFQLFFIRDDRSIAGLEESVGSLTVRMMADVCCNGAHIMNVEEWGRGDEGSGNSAETLSDAVVKVSSLLDDLETATYKLVSNYGNNRCRQRQFNNLTIVLWDTLQFNAEAIEYALFTENHIGDKLTPDSDMPALPITSYAYHVKLDMMVEVVLAGFEHNLYKPYEAAQMYWYAGYLLENHHGHMTGRIADINRGKLAAIASLGKKVKKCKAGPKKEALRQRWQWLSGEIAPRVRETLQVVDIFTAPALEAMHELCIAVSQTVLLYELFGASMSTPSCKDFVSEELVFRLRMKPWTSVEVPAAPSYDDYNVAMKFYKDLRHVDSISSKRGKLGDLSRMLADKFAAAHKRYAMLIDAFSSENCHLVVFPMGEGDVRGNIDLLRKTCVAYQVALKQFEKSLDQDPRDYHVVTDKRYHSYFPVYVMRR